jgi:uncharacterized surface protein with fasciclin (FAS1) repeats
MKRTILRRSSAVAAVLALSVSLAACGDDEEPTSGSDDTTSESAESSAPADDMTEDGEMDASADTFGDACSAIPTDGEGSFDGMVDDPVATAASNNPLLSTLVTAVGAAELVDTLNTAEGLTVFAPYNDAFAAIPEADLTALLEDKEGLTNVLTYHVVAGQLDPEAVVGEQTTLQGGTVTVEGDTSGMTVNGANVLCGNIPTANATVYVIDTVLSPEA